MEAMRPLTFLLLVILPCAARSACAETTEEIRLVAVPVADLRKEPVTPPAERTHDPFQESQLLYGDRVTILEEKEGWCRVEVAGQQEWSRNRRWQGYPGWVESENLVPAPSAWKPNLIVNSKSARLYKTLDWNAPLMTLPIGTSLQGLREVETWFTDGQKRMLTRVWEVQLPDGDLGWLVGSAKPLKAAPTEAPSELRAQIVRTARLFIGDPYYWGGRSAHDPQALPPPHTGVDCSGLTGLAYLASGIHLPRDAHEQWMKARPLNGLKKLQPADLIFLHDPKDPERVTHVMLYAGEGQIIEGPGTGENVRQTALEDRLREAAGRRISFGTYLQ